MPIHIEEHYQGSAAGRLVDKILNSWPLMIDTDSITSGGIGFFFTEQGKWKFARCVGNNGHLYMNAAIFLRVCLFTILPIGLFFHLRLSSTRLVQIGFGMKNNTGRLGLIFRFQTDKSAAAGYNAPNPDQTGGFEWGFH